MPEINHTYEYLAAIEKSIYELAEARCYDWLILAVTGLAVIVSGVAARYAYKLNDQQKDIAKKQSSISEQQNKIALFEKRYEIYFYFYPLAMSIRSLNKHKNNSDFIHKNSEYFKLIINEYSGYIPENVQKLYNTYKHSNDAGYLNSTMKTLLRHIKEYRQGDFKKISVLFSEEACFACTQGHIEFITLLNNINTNPDETEHAQIGLETFIESTEAFQNEFENMENLLKIN